MIGESHLRLGADRFVTGTGRFVEDVRVPGMLHAAVLRSPRAHARLIRSTPSAPSSCPACAVLTAADVPDGRDHPQPRAAPRRAPTLPAARHRPGVVRYVGEPVALVVADDPYVAGDALERIDVSTIPSRCAPSVADALAPGAPRLFPGTDSTTSRRSPMRVGDADTRAGHGRPGRPRALRLSAPDRGALETRGLVAVPPDPRGGELHLIGSTKCIHINRTILAPIFGLPPGALRLTEVTWAAASACAASSIPKTSWSRSPRMKLGRPVKWIESRRENLMAANHAREVTYEVEIGFDGRRPHRRACAP